VPFDARRLLFPPVPAAILALIMYLIYTAIFPLWMLSFTAGGTTIGKNFPNRSAFLCSRTVTILTEGKGVSYKHELKNSDM
jgi:hypothetical protein